MKQIALKGSLRFRMILRKILTGLSLGAVTFVFQACYGDPYWDDPERYPERDYEVDRITGTVRSENEEPVKGFWVSILCDHNHDAYTFTKADGTFAFYIYEWNAHEDGNYTLFFQDVDGPLNGEYDSQTVQWSSGDGPLNIVLEPLE